MPETNMSTGAVPVDRNTVEVTLNSRFGVGAQIDRVDAKIGKLYDEIAELASSRGHLLDNVQKWAAESDSAMTKRLRRGRIRRGLREARYLLTGSRAPSGKLKSLRLLKTFEYLYKACSKAGFHGVELTELGIAEKVGCSERHVRTILGLLDTTYHVLTRVPRPGQPTRYAIVLPESEPFRKMLLTTNEVRAKRTQRDATREASQLDLEPARAPGLERFHHGYEVPTKCLIRLRKDAILASAPRKSKTQKARKFLKMPI